MDCEESGAGGLVSAQMNAASHPRIVHPARKFKADIARADGCFLKQAMNSGRK